MRKLAVIILIMLCLFSGCSMEPYTSSDKLPKEELDRYTVSGEVISVVTQGEFYGLDGGNGDRETIYSDGTMEVSRGGYTVRELIKDQDAVKKILYLATKANPITEKEESRFVLSPDFGGSDLFVYDMNTGESKYVYSAVARENQSVHRPNSYASELIALINSTIGKSVLYDGQPDIQALKDSIYASDTSKEELKAKLMSDGYAEKLVDVALADYVQPKSSEENAKDLADMGFDKDIAEVIVGLPEVMEDHYDESFVEDTEFTAHLKELVEKVLPADIIYHRIRKDRKENTYEDIGTTSFSGTLTKDSSMPFEETNATYFDIKKALNFSLRTDLWQIKKESQIINGTSYTIARCGEVTYYMADDEIKFIINTENDWRMSDAPQIINVISVSY